MSDFSIARKLQLALLSKGEHILLVTNQFYSEKMQRPVNVYAIKKAMYNETTKRTQSVELFSTTSRLQVVLFLRDYWYEFNGWEVPHDNPEWEQKKLEGLNSSVYEKSL